MVIVEGTAPGYVGVVALLFALPLGWTSPGKRRRNLFFLFVAVLGLGWNLDLPVIVDLMRMPVLNMMSHNRLVFVSAFGLIAIAATGLDELSSGRVSWKSWYWIPFGLLIGLAGWCVYRAFIPDEMLGRAIPEAIIQGQAVMHLRTMDDLAKVKGWFSKHFLVASVFCSMGAAAWLWLRFGRKRNALLFVTVTMTLMADLMWYAQDRSSQSDPALYYPKIPALEQILHSTPGRVLGYSCFPSAIPMVCGLNDVRGIDGVDPARFMELATLGAQDMSATEYARSQWLVPKIFPEPDGTISLSPVFDMLGVRYLIIRGEVQLDLKPAIQSPDYWVMVNSNALPRVFVPERVETITDAGLRLSRMNDKDWQPAKLAFVEEPLSLPDNCRGSASIIEEMPTRIKVNASMETDGLLVLADMWDKGWHATVNGKPAEILVANHAVRGVILSHGESVVEFRYAPKSFALGLKLALGAAILLAAMLVFDRRKKSPVVVSL